MPRRIIRFKRATLMFLIVYFIPNLLQSSVPGTISLDAPLPSLSTTVSAEQTMVECPEEACATAIPAPIPGPYGHLPESIQKTWQMLLSSRYDTCPNDLNRGIAEFLKDLPHFGQDQCSTEFPAVLLNALLPSSSQASDDTVKTNDETSSLLVEKIMSFMAAPLGWPGSEQHPFKQFSSDIRAHPLCDPITLLMAQYLKPCLQAVAVVKMTRQSLMRIQEIAAKLMDIFTLKKNKQDYSLQLQTVYDETDMTMAIFRQQTASLVSQHVSPDALKLAGRIMDTWLNRDLIPSIAPFGLTFYLVLKAVNEYERPEMTELQPEPLKKAIDIFKPLLSLLSHTLEPECGRDFGKGAEMPLPGTAPSLLDYCRMTEHTEPENREAKIRGNEEIEEQQSFISHFFPHPQMSDSEKIQDIRQQAPLGTLQSFLTAEQAVYPWLSRLFSVNQPRCQSSISTLSSHTVPQALQMLYRSLNAGRSAAEKKTPLMIAYCAFAFEQRTEDGGKLPKTHDINHLDDPLYTEGHAALQRFFPPSPHHQGGEQVLDILQHDLNNAPMNDMILRQTILAIVAAKIKPTTLFTEKIRRLETLLSGTLSPVIWETAIASVRAGKSLSDTVRSAFHRAQTPPVYYQIAKHEPTTPETLRALFAHPRLIKRTPLAIPASLAESDHTVDASDTPTVTKADAELNDPARIKSQERADRLLIEQHLKEGAAAGRKFFHRLFLHNAHENAAAFFKERAAETKATPPAITWEKLCAVSEAATQKWYQSIQQSPQECISDDMWGIILARAAIFLHIQDVSEQHHRSQVIIKNIKFDQHQFVSAFQSIDPYAPTDHYYRDKLPPAPDMKPEVKPMMTPLMKPVMSPGPMTASPDKRDLAAPITRLPKNPSLETAYAFLLNHAQSQESMFAALSLDVIPPQVWSSITETLSNSLEPNAPNLELIQSVLSKTRTYLRHYTGKPRECFFYARHILYAPLIDIETFDNKKMR